MNTTPNDYQPAPDEMRDAWINDYDSGMPREAEYCQHGNCPDDGCDKCESNAQWIDEKALHEENAGDEDVCVPALSSAPPQPISPAIGTVNPSSGADSNRMTEGGVAASLRVPLQLDYPVWRMSFSEYGNQNGLEVPEQDVTVSAYDELEYWEQGEQE